MFTLLSECHLWTMREDIHIKSTDFGTFRYMRQREWQSTLQNDLIATTKRDYTERRNGMTVLKRSRKSSGRLKENLKHLEELLRLHKVVHIHWTDATQLLLLFTNGIITHICIDAFTGDILRMVFEKYLIGKLASDAITDAFFTRSHIVLAYSTNQVTVIHLTKSNTRPQGPEKITNMEPKIFHALIPGTGAERKLLRRISVNQNGDLFLLWTKSSQNEVFPWRPTVRDQDRANIHVFKLKECQLDFFSYCWSENDPLHVDFMRSMDNCIITLEQKISRKSEITAELCSYEIVTGKMQRNVLSTIIIGAQITCFSFSPDQEKLFLASADKTICLHDLVLQSTKSIAQIDIMSTQCSWHSDSSLIMIANTRSQFQCFDLALTPVGNQLQSEDVTPAHLLDLSHYFVHQPPTLLHISFSKKPEFGHYTTTKYAATDSFLLLVYDNGPIGCLRLFASAGILGDIHNSGLTADIIIDKYLCLNQLEKAVNLLYALNWETYGAMCLISLHKITNYVLYHNDQRKLKIELLIRALKTFSDTLSEETKDEFSDQVFDLKRRFFFHLLRQKMFSEAFEVAQDIEDYDLFMDLYNVTKDDKNSQEFATSAFRQAAIILHEEDRANGSLSIAGDYHSDSACSQSTVSDTVVNSNNINGVNKLHQQHMQHHTFLKNYVPPLPSFKSKILNAETIKINIPKLLELHNHRNQHHAVAMDNKQLQQQRLSLPLVTNESLIQQQQSTSGFASTLAMASNLFNLTVKGDTILSNDNSNSDGNSNNKTNNESLIVNKNNWAIDNEATDKLALNSTLSNKQNFSTSTHVHMTTSVTIPKDHSVQQLTTYQPKIFQHPLVSGHIPPPTLSVSLAAHSHSNEEYQKSLLNKRPTASILANSQNSLTTFNNGLLPKQQQQQKQHLRQQTTNIQNSLCKDNKHNHGEKNKVKFSDTVQVAVVPAITSLQEIPRKEKSIMTKRNGYARPHPTPPVTYNNYTNPKKELADSLPLCHPNDEYLKDFNPLSSGEKFKSVKIKEHMNFPSSKCINNVNESTTIATTIVENNTTMNNSIATTAVATTLTMLSTESTQSSFKVVHFGVV